MKRFIIAAFTAVLLISAVTGCHTMKGAGEDIESAGEGIQNAVD